MNGGPEVWLAVAHAAAAWVLVGLTWTVSVVVYPAFSRVGPAGEQVWERYHLRHVRGMTPVVAPPWAVQGLTTAGLLALRPDGVPLWLLGLDAVLVAVPVALTVLAALPAHSVLEDGYDGAADRRLQLAHAWRTASWTGAAVTATSVLLLTP